MDKILLLFTLAEATHKQDDRAYVFFHDGMWQYSLTKPKCRFEVVVNADEAFDIVKKRNMINTMDFEQMNDSEDIYLC